MLLVDGEADRRPLVAVEAFAAELPQRLVRPGVGHVPWWEGKRRKT